jgi:hypothetical protein
MKKFMKSYFMIDDNIIDKKLMRYIDEKTFTSKKNVKHVMKQIIESFAVNFTDGK